MGYFHFRSFHYFALEKRRLLFLFLFSKWNFSLTMTEKVISPTSPLEQFVLLAKSAKGAAAVELVKQALEAPGVYVFGELLDMPNIIELQGEQFQSYFDMLNLFAFGTYRQYLERKDTLPELTPAMQQKLRHLTIVTLSESNKCIPYKVLVEQLDMKNLRELEDLVIEAIYGDVIRGKLDQRNGQLEIDFAEQSRAEQSRAEQSRAEQSRAEQS